MQSKLCVEYNVDKLELTFEIPYNFQFPEKREVFINNVQNDSISKKIELWNCNPNLPSSLVFMCLTDINHNGKYQVKSPSLKLYCLYLGQNHYIGLIKTHMIGAVRLCVDNRFLYSGLLYLLYELEKAFGIEFKKVSSLDICCDSNQNLPKKLNDTLHSSRCEVYRLGRRKDQLPLTTAGNLILGTKVAKNIKVLQNYERAAPSYVFTLTNAGSKVPMKLRGYNKSSEIREKSKKDYIEEALPFYGNIHRLEIAVISYDLTLQSKNKKGYSHRFIYEHLTDKAFLKSFFIQFINRFYQLKIEGKKTSISKLLRLDSV